MAATALVAAMTVPIVRSLFERGQFTAESTTGTAQALFFYAFAIPVWGGLQILNRAFYARREMWTPVIVGTAATIAAVPLYVILQSTFGLRGVAFASTLVLGIYTAILASVWYGDRDGSRRVRALAAQLGRGVPPAVLGGLATFGLTYGIAQLFDFAAMASAVKTALSVVIVIVGTAAFVGVAIVIGSILHDWLSGRAESSNQPAMEPEPEVEAGPEVEQVPNQEPVPKEDRERSEF